jgi:hypothetical protein
MALKPHRPEAGGGARCNVALACVLAAAAILTGWPKSAAAITVVDPQTLLLGEGKKIRLFDIVTPKSPQCGCVAECLARVEHDQRTMNLHHEISTELNEADPRMNVVSIHEGVLQRERGRDAPERLSLKDASLNRK